MASTEKTLKIINDDDVPVEILAENIQAISEGMTKLRSGRLNERALLVLLRDATNLPMKDIRYVLNALDQLESLYLKPKPKQP